MNPSRKHRVCGVLAAACLLAAVTVPAIQQGLPLPSVTLSVSAAETTTYGDLTLLLYSDYVEVADCNLSATSVKIPSKMGGKPVRVIGERAFYGCTNLQSVTISDNVQMIGDNAFAYCSALTELTLPESVTAIGDDAFYGCSGLTGLQLPSQLLQIGTAAFEGCTGLTALELPASVTTLGDNIFAECTSLQQITVAAGNSAFVSVDGVLLNQAQTTLIRYPIAKSGTAYTVPTTVTEVAPSAFESCTRLTEIILPSTLRSIGAWAFANTGLTAMNMPNSVRTVDDHAFCACTALTDVTLSSNLQELGAGAFWGCTALQNVVLPNKLQSVSYCLFYGCTELRSVTVPQSVQNIENEAFSGSDYQIDMTVYTDSYAHRYFEKQINGSLSIGAIPKYSLTLLEAPAIMKGDPNNDGIVGVEDAVQVLQTYAQQSAGLSVEISDAVFTAMDVDENGQISVEDAVKILTYYARQSAGLEVSWDF
ncbi:MAG: leucine-rich repeat protein [Ruminococcus callidus]|nr:leucine-rich repeat protein [Ruminococcus callidus]